MYKPIPLKVPKKGERKTQKSTNSTWLDELSAYMSNKTPKKLDSPWMNDISTNYLS